MGSVKIRKTFQADKILGEFLHETAKSVADDIEKIAKSICPVRGGKLRDSI